MESLYNMWKKDPDGTRHRVLFDMILSDTLDWDESDKDYKSQVVNGMKMAERIAIAHDLDRKAEPAGITGPVRSFWRKRKISGAQKDVKRLYHWSDPNSKNSEVRQKVACELLSILQEAGVPVDRWKLDNDENGTKRLTSQGSLVRPSTRLIDPKNLRFSLIY